MFQENGVCGHNPDVTQGKFVSMTPTFHISSRTPYLSYTGIEI